MKLRHEKLADGIDLWCGDARELLGEVGKVSHVITDPPYEEHMHKAKAAASGRKVYGSKRRIRIDGHADPKPITFSSIGDLRAELTKPLVDICDGWLIAFCTPEGIAAWRDAIEAAGARYKRACFWHKPDSSPQFNGQGPAMAVEAFVTAWCGDGFSKWNGGGGRNLFTHNTNQPDRDGTHETEKPVPLMAELVMKFSNVGETILDPFMGSGTTGIACARTGRRFIGFEKDPAFFDLAVRRIAASIRQADMFVEVPKPLKQASMV